MNRKNIWKKAGSAFLTLVLASGIGSAGRSETVMAANASRTVSYGAAAVSTDGYTVKDDEYGSRKIWDSVNGQYVYLGGIKFHLLSRDDDGALLRTAAVVKCEYGINELTQADIWDKLDPLEQAQVLEVSLPEETFTANNTVYTAPALERVTTYQLSLNDVFRYYGGLTDHYDGYTRSDCHISKNNIIKEPFWVNYSIYGALKLDLSSVAFTTAAEVKKPDTFSTTGWVRDNKSNRLTFSDGTAFQASMTSTQAAENGTVQVTVDNLPETHSYTQISAMAIDAKGSVTAYGKIGDARAGTHSFTLPDSMNAGTYTLKVFAEAVSENTNASDHVSNMAEFTLTVTKGTKNTVSVINLSDTHMQLAAGSGDAKQTVASENGITSIIYTVDSYLEPDLKNSTSMQCGYYLPEGYESKVSLEGTGLQMTIDEARKTVTISGTPTRNVELVLPAAEAQRSRGNVSQLLCLMGDGKLGGTTADMVWYTDINSPQACTEDTTATNITDQKVIVCYKPTIEYPVTGKASFSLDTCHKITTEYNEQYGTVKVTVNGHETSYAEYNTDGYYRFPTLEIAPIQGYQCGKVEILNLTTNQSIDWKTNGTFWMPAADVKISVTFELKTYAITVAEAAGGTASTSHTAAAKETEITLTAKPQEDYQLAGWQVVRTDGTGKIEVQDHTFMMPEGEVTVTPIFALKQTSIAQAEEAIWLIDAIGQVAFTEECASRITQARNAYNCLSAVQKTLISEEKLALLTNAEAVFAELKEQTEAEQAAAKAVEDKILAIGAVSYTDRCKAAIGEARAAYEELEEAQKRWITEETLMLLTTAEKTYLELKSQSDGQLADQAAANTAIGIIGLIGEVSYSDTSKAAINAARAVYDRLTAEQQALIPAEQLAILTNAEAAYAALQQQAEEQKAAEEAAKRAEEEKKAAEEAAKRAEEEKKAADQAAADTAVNAINAIGTVVYSEASKAAIDAARAAYNALTEEQKALIPAEKVTALTDAEASYTALTAAALAPKLEQKKAGKDSITISWKADQKATAGYRIYVKGGSFKKFTKAADTQKGVISYTIKKVSKKKLTAGTQYEIKVVSLKKNGKKMTELSTQKLKAVTVTAAPKFTSAARSKNGKNITLKWKKISGASGYEIQMSTKAKSGFKKIKTVNAKTASYTRKSLSKSKTYYFRMRSYKTVNGTKFYSSWSGVKKVNKK